VPIDMGLLIKAASVSQDGDLKALKLRVRSGFVQTQALAGAGQRMVLANMTGDSPNDTHMAGADKEVGARLARLLAPKPAAAGRRQHACHAAALQGALQRHLRMGFVVRCQ